MNTSARMKQSFGERTFDVFVIVFLGLLSFIFLYPLLHVLFASFSDPMKLFQHKGILLWPKGFSLVGYERVLRSPLIGTGYVNTIFYVVAGTSLNILMTCFGAYVLSRRTLYIRRVLTLMIVFTMHFGGGLIPSFINIRNLGLFNNRLALLLPVAIATWNLIVMRTAFLQMPESLDEAARIDGANDFTILFRIYIPVTKATLAVMILFYSVGHWNSWFNAMIFLQDREKYPLQLFLREVLIASNMASLEGDNEVFSSIMNSNLVKYCTIVISTLPILCIYPFLQKYFAKGVMVGSVKE